MSPQTLPLPNTTVFLTSIIDSLNHLSSNVQGDGESLSGLDSAAKASILTLHAAFPTLLLPALDLLDRHLITRFIYFPAQSGDHTVAVPADAEANDELSGGEASVQNRGQGRVVYYVRSSAQSNSRSHPTNRVEIGSKSYEVRPRAWSCTCAAFAFAAFNNLPGFADVPANFDREECNVGLEEENRDGKDDRMEDEQWRWGGMMLRHDDAPLCKHLLACVMTERWRLAEKMIEVKEVGRDEVAGWTAVWSG